MPGRGAEADGRHRDEGGLVALRFFGCTKPVIGAINGPAVGVGVTMTLPFDVRLASTTARFGFVFARRGLVPEACSSWFLPRVVGISRAMEWCATGRVFGPDEALAGGLVRSVHEPDALLPAAYEPGRRDRHQHVGRVGHAHPGDAVAHARRRPSHDAHRIDSAFSTRSGRGADVREGVTSFLEKRPPDFPGRVPADLPARLPLVGGTGVLAAAPAAGGGRPLQHRLDGVGEGSGAVLGRQPGGQVAGALPVGGVGLDAGDRRGDLARPAHHDAHPQVLGPGAVPGLVEQLRQHDDGTPAASGRPGFPGPPRRPLPGTTAAPASTGANSKAPSRPSRPGRLAASPTSSSDRRPSRARSSAIRAKARDAPVAALVPRHTRTGASPVATYASTAGSGGRAEGPSHRAKPPQVTPSQSPGSAPA